MEDLSRAEMMTFQCQPAGWFGWNYEMTGNGRQAQIMLRSMSEAGQICVDGEDFDINKESWLKGHWALKQGDQLVASAVKTSSMTRTVEFRVGDQTLLLEAESLFRRSFRLRKNDTLLARIYPASWVSRKATIETYHAGASVALSCFAFWVVLVQWRRAASSS